VAGHGLQANARLLRHILESAPGGRVFTTVEALESAFDLGISAEHTYKLLSQMVERGQLDRPRRRLYAMKPPFGGVAPVRPLAIAVRAVTPAAVSGDTALVHWGLLAQAPLDEEVVSTPARIQWSDVRADGVDRLWTIDGTTVRFHHVLPREMFGIAVVRLDNETLVPMFDRERALLDVVMRSDPSAREWARELLRDHWGVIDVARIRRYAEQVDVGEQLAFDAS
jgi:predicted transcriptional regulator of viral defense system